MKTRQTIAAMLLAAVGIWSCQQEAFQEEEMLEKDVKEGVVNKPAPLKQMSVTALWQSDETRTSVYHDGGAYQFLWEPGDAISLVEVDPSVTEGNMAQTAQSNTLSERCSTARFSMALADREAGDNLHYVAYYPAAAMPEGKAAGWDAAGRSVQLPLTLPLVQRPVANSFDGAADLLVSHQVDLNARPEDIELTFERVGTVLKLVVTGLEEGTKIMGGTLDLGYDCSGEILYDAKTRTWSKTETGKQIEFCYATKNDETGEVEGTPLEALNGSATIWLRVLAGKADDWVTLSINTLTLSDKGKIKINTVTRDIDLKRRGATINFKEGGVTTFSATLTSPEVILPSTLTSVPKLYIGAAFDDITSKTAWVTTTATFVNGDGTVLYEDGEASIRGRGNTTWTYPKKPYYLKLNKEKKKVNMFDTNAKSRKYILLANWMDRTNLRNAVAFEAARRTSIKWTPKGEFVDVYLNGEHKGLYYLVEKIEAEEGRLDLKYKTDRKDFLYTFDTSDPSEPHFFISYGYRPNTGITGLPVEIKFPDPDDYEDDQTGWNEVKSVANTSFDALNTAIHSQDIETTVDLASFCDWYLVHELCVNEEPKHPKSCYIYRENGKFYAGPVWDFDWGTFIPTPNATGLLPTIRNSLFYGKSGKYTGLFDNPAFVAKLKARWAELEPEFKTLGSYIDDQATWIQNAETANHSLWPIVTGTDPFTGEAYTRYAVTANGDQNLTFQQAVKRMKDAIDERIREIGTAIGNLQ